MEQIIDLVRELFVFLGPVGAVALAALGGVLFFLYKSNALGKASIAQPDNSWKKEAKSAHDALLASSIRTEQMMETIQGNATRMEGKIDKMDDRQSQFGERLSKLEGKVDMTIERVEDIHKENREIINANANTMKTFQTMIDAIEDARQRKIGQQWNLGHD